MPGSLRLVGKPDVWELRAYAGRDANGRVRHAYGKFRGTRRAAERALAELVADRKAQTEALEGTIGVWGSKTTINDALEAWRQNGWEDLSPTTVRRYEGVWNTHVRDSIGQRAIASLSPYDVERYYRMLKKQGLAEGSVRYARAVMNRGCKLARKWSGGVLPNPIADSELPKWGLAESTVVRSPDSSEVQSLLAAAIKFEDPRVATAIRVLAATGMRRGEACALRWSDIDFSAAIVAIDESVIGAKGGASVKQPKTRASIRRLVVDEDTLKMLFALRGCQQQLAEACDVTIKDESFVFAFEPGGLKPPHPDVLSHAFARVRKHAEVAEDVHLHSLRHFQATIIDAVVSERQKQARLGWSTAQMARHYTDPVLNEDRRAAEHVRIALTGSEAPQDGHQPDSDGIVGDSEPAGAT
jgi:integrase